MAKSTRGTYIFEDGARIWFHGLSGLERKVAIRDHGKIIRFIPD